MTNEHPQDLIAHISNQKTQSSLTLTDEFYSAYSTMEAYKYLGETAAQFAVFVRSIDDIKYLDIEAESADDALSGRILAITSDLIVQVSFGTPPGVDLATFATASAYRRSDITSVTVTGATAPVRDTSPWPTQLEVKVHGDGWSVTFPRRMNRDDSLGQLVPSLLA